MVRMCVVILSGRSLFAEGVANRLRQYLQSVELEIVDPRQPEAMTQIAAAQPSIVILDGSDLGSTQLCSLSKLLLAFPKLTVICLDSQQEQMQVVTSEQHPAVKVHDLVEVINQSV